MKKAVFSILFLYLFFRTVDPANAQINLTSPNGGEVWGVGSTQTISWTYSGVPPYAIAFLEYSTDNGTTWNFIWADSVAKGNMAWIVPNAPSSQCLVRIKNGTTNIDVSDAVFSISNTTDIGNTQREYTLNVYPNPAIDLLHIKYPIDEELENIELIDSKGCIVYEVSEFEATGNGYASLNVYSIPKGVYTLVIRSQTKALVRKVILTH